MLIEQAIAETLGERADTCLWLGLSAGIDSTVLLYAVAHYCASQYSVTTDKKLKVIHVHHGLSENADAWAIQAQNLCTELSQKFSLNIECFIEKVKLDDRADGLEQAARSARYQAFEKYCGPNDALLQGHHLDDQIETFFMRAIRGSGLTGLASIPKQRSLSRANSCQILRPLLTIEKTQLIEYAQKHRLYWVEDESNQDSRIDRNWWRNELLPQIWQRYPKQKQSLSRTISTIQHEQNFLQQLIINNIAIHNESSFSEPKIHSALKDIPSFDLLLIQQLDQAACLSYVRAWLAQHVDILPSALQMQTLYLDMILARVDSEPQFEWLSSSLYRYHDRLYLLSAVALKCVDSTAHENMPIDWHGENIRYCSGELLCTLLVDDFALKPGKYILRRWKAGDVAKPSGRSTRKIKKWWQDYNVPSWIREQWPIIVNEESDEVVAIPGLFVCQGYCVEQGQAGWLVEYKLVHLEL
jgi:tRNA(Ile)-lysidine synthase